MDFGEGDMGDIPTRRMRAKILYTFDQDNKTNCLARFPDILDIPAVAIDDSNQVGVISLNQCIQAVVTASPEIVSRLSNGDFTIYAYDYSEEDTPLVGQGMLSAALAAYHAEQPSNTMITGRVCTNSLAVFNNGAKETLEVKMRLVPVAQPALNEFTRGIEQTRSQSPAMSSGFDPNAWSAGVQQQKSQQQTQNYFGMGSATSNNDRNMALVDEIFGLPAGESGAGDAQSVSGGMGMAETPNDPTLDLNPAFSHSAPGSRAGSPMTGSQSITHNNLLRHQSFPENQYHFGPEPDQSRPASRASVRSDIPPSRHQRQASAQSVPQQPLQQQTEIFYNEEGQPRKRAKVMQADWGGRSSFGGKPSDLRVSAATGASMQMHRPIPKRPTAPGSNLEPPPRAPTPVPQLNRQLPQAPLQAQQGGSRRSMLRQASVADSDFMSDFDNYSDALMSSPEEDSPGNSINADGTPLDIPSSPPVFQSMHQPQPSSPGLPSLPLPPSRVLDSGYMSELGPKSGSFMQNDDGCSPEGQDQYASAQYQSYGNSDRQSSAFPPDSKMHQPQPANARPKEMRMSMEKPGDMNQLPQKMLLNLPPGSRGREGSQGPAKQARAPLKRNPPSEMSEPSPVGEGMGQEATVSKFRPSEPPPSRRGSLALPLQLPPPSSGLPQQRDNAAPKKPAAKKKPPLPRANTSYYGGSEIGSPAPSDTESSSRPKGPNRSGGGAHRRKLIEARLQNAIAKGEMPEYCTHCGAIETPTWRRIYVKECDGKPSPLDYVEGEGETIAIEETEMDETTGEATKFVIRKSMKKTKENQPGTGFEDTMLCNPCGLWFNRFKTMRPSSKWGRKAATRRRTKKTSDENGIATDGLEPQSDMPQSDVFFTDAVAPEEATETTENSEEGRTQGQTQEAAKESRPAPSKRKRANSMQAQQPRRGSGQDDLSLAENDPARKRVVQSSPARFQGSQQSPIEIDELTPRPTRRLLFPSPRSQGEMKTLEENRRVSPKPLSFTDNKPSLKSGPDVPFDANDGNVFEAFAFADKENIAPPLDLDDDDFARLFGGSPPTVFKTPRKSASKTSPRSLHQLNSLLKTPTQTSKKRNPLTPTANNAASAAGNAASHHINGFLTSPSSGRYFLRSTPSRLERTPGRVASSPWSQSFAKMLGEVTQAGGSGEWTSPSRGSGGLDFGVFGGVTSPGRTFDWEGLEGLLGSEELGEMQEDEGVMAEKL